MAEKKVKKTTEKVEKVVKKDFKTMDELVMSLGEEAVFGFKRGQQVEGTIISATNREVLIDIGGKSEGILAAKEQLSSRDLIATMSPGDKIEATVLVPENEQGQVVLSLRKIGGEKRWEELTAKIGSSEEIDAIVVDSNRGGLILDFSGLRGFLPTSQMSSQERRPAKLMNKSLKVKVLEADRSSNRLIFSQKSAGISSEDLDKKKEVLAKITVGDKFSGEITAVMPFGVFVRVEPVEGESIEGLVHISEMSWEKVEDPNNEQKVGNKVEVVATAVLPEEGKLTLSIKRLKDNPWEEVASRYPKDTKVSGKVTRLTGFGAFVQIDKDVEGLMHISKIPPELNVEVGQEIECTVESIDVVSRRISLAPILTEKPLMYR
ncbi:S1 RNA-binding domain-containing protein [Candidatus Curtissbacteria bacterium]|nr:S1 RNA-binding domain-containing protein [Candidatus Curtissbacteria bacterium]